jgi:hypothetical protein
MHPGNERKICKLFVWYQKRKTFEPDLHQDLQSEFCFEIIIIMLQLELNSEIDLVSFSLLHGAS